MTAPKSGLHHFPSKEGKEEEAEISAEKNKQAPSSAQAHKSGPLNILAKILLPLLILFVAVTSYKYLKSTKPKPRKPLIVEKVWSVDSIKAVSSNQIPTLKLYGKTVSSRHVDLRALVSGKIVLVGNGLKEGALVKQGDLLLEIDNFDYKGAVREASAYLAEAVARKAELQASTILEQEKLKFAKIQLALGKKDYKRAETLSKRGTVTKKLADDRNVIVSQRAQAVATSKVNLDLQHARKAQQAAVIERLKWKVSQAERRLEETRLLAPFDAYVSTVNAEIGRTMSVNDTVATLIDQNKIDIRFTLTNAQYGRILAQEQTLNGREVNVSWNVGETPVHYSATVKRTGAVISSQNGGVEIYASVKNPTKTVPLRSGAFVEVRIKDREYKNVYRLPQTALYNGNKIYIIKKGRLSERTIQVVGASGSDTLIRASLKVGERILTTRLTLAGEGVKVRMRNQSAQKLMSQQGGKDQQGEKNAPGSKGL